jgi:hypothetical protein
MAIAASLRLTDGSLCPLDGLAVSALRVTDRGVLLGELGE